MGQDVSLANRPHHTLAPFAASVFCRAASYQTHDLMIKKEEDHDHRPTNQDDQARRLSVVVVWFGHIFLEPLNIAWLREVAIDRR